MAASKIQDCITELQGRIAAIAGIRAAPAAVPDQINAFPFVAAWVGPGRLEAGPAGALKFLPSIILELHVSLKNLPRDAALADSFIDLINNEIMADPTFDGNAHTFNPPVTFSGLIGMDYAGVATIGYRWTINDVKIERAII